MGLGLGVGLEEVARHQRLRCGEDHVEVVTVDQHAQARLEADLRGEGQGGGEGW